MIHGRPVSKGQAFLHQVQRDLLPRKQKSDSLTSDLQICTIIAPDCQNLQFLIFANYKNIPKLITKTLHYFNSD